MFAMLRLAKAAKEAAPMCMANVHGWFRRVFKEQAGGAEIIATIVIIGIVLVLAFIFRDNLVNLVASLWEQIISPSKSEQDAFEAPTFNKGDFA